MRTIESEIGRVHTPDFDSVAAGLKPKERIWSLAYSFLCMRFCNELSYRQAADLINAALHRHEESLMKVRTLADFIERTGSQIQGYLTAVTEKVLKDSNYEPETDEAVSDVQNRDTEPMAELTAEQAEWDNEIAEKAGQINEQREPREQIKDLERFPRIESPKEKRCYISIDDVGVKHQKETRKDGCVKDGRFVNNTVMHIQSGDGSYCLTTSGMENAFRMLMAFLLSNNLLDHTLVFFADGAQDIRCYIAKYFAHYSYTLILDWYHLRKKCKELVSSSIKGTIAQKKEHSQNLLRMLWVGNVKEALLYLNELDASQIKSGYWLGVLTKYLERKEPQIVCYALRYEFGLRISSNRAEKANDILVAQRQKHNGMSWSVSGSRSLASLAMVMHNGDTLQWLRTHSLSFSLPEKSAA